jgi:hypothetical protein
MSSNIPLFITSSDRINPTSTTSTNFLFSFSEDVRKINQIKIECISIPYSFYGITAANNTLVFNNGAVTVTIPPGNYSINTLLTTLEAVILAAFPTATPAVTWDITTLKLTITMTSAFTVNSTTTQPTSTLAPFLGFKANSTSGTTATGDSALNIRGPSFLFIKSVYLSKLLRTSIKVSDNKGSALNNTFLVVPINVIFGNYITLFPDQVITFANAVTIKKEDNIDLQITYEDGTIVDLVGLDWSLSLSASIY